MFRLAMLLVVTTGLAGMALWGQAQPPGDGGPGEDAKGPPPKGQKGGRGEKGPKGDGKFGAKGKGKGFQPGTVIPPHILDELELTGEQTAAIREIEKDVKGKLEKILTPEQLQKIRDARPPMGGPGGGGPGGGGRPGRGPGEGEVRQRETGGIQWFSTLESARAEAARTGRPILLVSAAPHCAGIPGIW